MRFSNYLFPIITSHFSIRTRAQTAQVRVWPLLALVSETSDPGPSLSVTAMVGAITSPPPTPTGWPP